MWSESKTHIGTLRVHGTRANPSSLQLRLSRLLNTAELRSAGIPPSAVLVVRRLADPLPGRLAPSQLAARVDAAWERAAQVAMASIYRSAARPGKGPVPAGAEAVVFADEAEMLTCLALDMSRGEVQQRWWWHLLWRTLPSPSAAGLTTMLCRRAVMVPAILSYLVERGEAVRVLEALPLQQAIVVLVAMGQAYGIADFGLDPAPSAEPSGSLAPRLAALHPEARQVDGSRNLPPADPSSAQRPHGSSVPPPVTPWSIATASRTMGTAPWTSKLVPPRLAKERACLLGVGLTLYDRPTVARSSVFLQALRQWWATPWEAAVSYRSGAPGMGYPVLLPQREAPEAIDRAAAMGSALSSRLDRTRAPDAHPTHVRRQEGSMARQVLHEDGNLVFDTSSEDRDDSGIAQDALAGGEFRETSETASESDHHPLRQAGEAQWEDSSQRGPRGQTDEPLGTMATDLNSKPQPTARHEISLLLAGGVQTELGGVLYLINLMRHLDLPACFEVDWGLDSQVGPWGVLEILGRSLLSGNSVDLRTDPLWAALALLAGRESEELPGAAYCGSDRFDLPAHWLIPVRNQEEQAFHWATDHRRLRLWAAQGYLVVDWPRNGFTPYAQARHALQAYQRDVDSNGSPSSLNARPFDEAPIDPLTSPLGMDLNPHLRRWLALVLPYLRLRLRQALTQGSAEEYDLDQALLRRRGWLYVTSTHVDLVMNLDDVSLPVRLAGLDANPGWMADFSRVVLFHFE